MWWGLGTVFSELPRLISEEEAEAWVREGGQAVQQARHG